MKREPMTEQQIYDAIEGQKAETERLRTEVTRCQTMLQEIGESNDRLRRELEHSRTVNEKLGFDAQQALAHARELKDTLQRGA